MELQLIFLTSSVKSTYSKSNHIVNRFHEIFHFVNVKLCFTLHIAHCTVWKNEKFSLTKKIFRQINSLAHIARRATYLVKPLISRNFCQKCVKENSRNFNTGNFTGNSFAKIPSNQRLTKEFYRM